MSVSSQSHTSRSSRPRLRSRSPARSLFPTPDSISPTHPSTSLRRPRSPAAAEVLIQQTPERNIQQRKSQLFEFLQLTQGICLIDIMFMHDESMHAHTSTFSCPTNVISAGSDYATKFKPYLK